MPTCSRHPASQAAPIGEVARALGLAVQGRKAHCYNGAAHKHGEDRHPSLTLFEDTNRFHCFACGHGGDAIDLVRAVRGLSFGEAVTFLERLAGGCLPSTAAGGRARPGPTPHPGAEARTVYAALRDLCHPPRPDSPGGAYLLSRRGLDPALAARHHTAEMADPDQVWRRLQADFGYAWLQAAGLASRAGAFLFARHRLLFFYADGGAPAFVQARDVTGTAACKELRPCDLACPLPYNGDLLASCPERVFVCEGCIDTLSALQLGRPAVGVPGAHAFADDWFARFPLSTRVTVFFDNDDAGHAAAADLRTRFRLKGYLADAVRPARGKDVNDLLVSQHERTTP
jgi:DNA primase